MDQLSRHSSPTAPYDGRPSELDIYIYAAHLQLSETDLRSLIDRAFVELDIGYLAADTSIIVADDFNCGGFADPRVSLLQSSRAGQAFRLRCRQLESCPRDIVVCFGAFLPSADVIGQLRRTLHQDAMVSAAAPRIAIEPEGHVVAIGGDGCTDSPLLLDRKESAALPSVYYSPEQLFPCMCIKDAMVGNVGVPDEFDLFPDLVLAFLRAGRRRGFSVLVDNAAVIPVSHYDFDKRKILCETAKMQLWLDYETVKTRLERHPAVDDERRLQVPASPRNPAALSLLLDCTPMGPIHNGTTEFILGAFKGINQADQFDCAVTAMTSDEARDYHNLTSRFPAISFVPTSEQRVYDVALHLTQAWSLPQIGDLNRRARSIGITILDVIGPDIVYVGPADTEEAFQFAGEHADGLIYISEFSRQQYRRRYFTSAELIEAVIYLSLDPADYVPVEHKTPSTGEWILLFGNPYDHKDLPRTIEILASAFPFESFKVVGGDMQGVANVEGFASGDLDSGVADNLYRNAKCIVFPSFYEGFGLPVVKGLAHGKTVIARSSRLLHEIAPMCANVGRLIEFTNSMDLLPIVAPLLSGRCHPAMALGDKLVAGQPAYSWLTCGEHILDFAKRLKASENPDRWRRRDRALRYILGPR
jgi:glycosyltransferase involved in cell wall biosynthesis